MSPSLEYCRMPASTPICVRMVLVELLGFTKQGTFSVKTGIVSGFRLAMGLLCWLQFSWMMYTPHPVSMAVMYLHLWHLSFDGKILSGSKSPKTILIYTGYFSLLQICFPPIKAIKVFFFNLPLMWPQLLHTLVVSSIFCLSTSTSTYRYYLRTSPSLCLLLQVVSQGVVVSCL